MNMDILNIFEKLRHIIFCGNLENFEKSRGL